jgi:trans-2,3-dihydro-3-hydroxyanthranilate isomerase
MMSRHDKGFNQRRLRTQQRDQHTIASEGQSGLAAVRAPGKIAGMATTRKLSLVQVDVFTDRALTGNALAVILDGRGLTTEQMQAVARETNLSETTFILPGEAEEKTRGVRVRIFTVQEELPFAGHPTLGTAFVMRGQSAAAEVLLNLNVGTVPVRFTQPGSSRLAFGEMTQKNPEFGAIHEPQAIAALTNLSASDFDPSVPIQTVSTGMPFTIAPVRSLKTLQGLRVDLPRAAEYLTRSGGKFLYFVCPETVDPNARLHARMIFYNGEDPATGSAAGCCAAWMVAHDVAASDEQVMIEQGLEMHRPSSIFVRASKHDNQVINVRVGGNCVEVLRGEITLPI